MIPKDQKRSSTNIRPLKTLYLKVYVGDQLCGTITYNPIKYGYTVECGEEGHGVVGQTVKIVNEKTFLTLCEVKVVKPLIMSTS